MNDDTTTEVWVQTDQSEFTLAQAQVHDLLSAALAGTEASLQRTGPLNEPEEQGAVGVAVHVALPQADRDLGQLPDAAEQALNDAPFVTDWHYA